MLDPLDLRSVATHQLLVLPKSKDGRLEVLTNHGDALQEVILRILDVRARSVTRPDGESVKVETRREDDTGDQVGHRLVMLWLLRFRNGSKGSLKRLSDSGKDLRRRQEVAHEEGSVKKRGEDRHVSVSDAVRFEMITEAGMNVLCSTTWYQCSDGIGPWGSGSTTFHHPC